MDSEIRIINNRIPVTIGFHSTVYTEAMGGTGYTIEVNPDGKNYIAIIIDNTDDIDNLIDQLLSHRKIITDYEKK